MQQFQRCKHPITVLPSLKEQHLATSPDKDRRLFHDMLLLMLPGQYYTRTDFLRLELQLDHSSILHREHLVNLKQDRSEEHTSELQSRIDLVCRLLLEIKKSNQ